MVKNEIIRNSLRHIYSWCLVFSFFFINVGNSKGQNYFNLTSYAHLPTFPEASMFDLIQDDDGYLWVATDKGLYKFNGNNFFHPNILVDNGRKLPEEAFQNLFKDSNGRIWAGTFSGGLYLIDIHKNVVFHFLANKNEKNTLLDNRIKKVYEDPQGRIWVGCHKEGFCMYRPDSSDFICYKPSLLLGRKGDERFLDDVLSFHFQNNLLWIGTLDVLLSFDPLSEELQLIDYKNKINESPKIFSAFNGVKDIVKVSDSEIAFHAYVRDAILFVYNIHDGDLKVKRLIPKPQKEFGSAMSIYEKDGVIYYLSKDKIAKITVDNWSIEWIFNVSEYSNEPFDIYSIHEDNEGGQWAISRRNLYKINKDTEGVSSIGLPGKNHSLTEINQNAIVFLDGQEQNVKIYAQLNDEIQTSQYKLSGVAKNNTVIREFFISKDEKIYGHSDGDIYSFNKETKRIEHYWGWPEFFNENSPEAIINGFLDRNGYYWMSTKNSGLLQFNVDSKTTSVFKNDANRNDSLIVYNGYAEGFYQDDLGNVWYGTDVGFGYYNHEDKRFTNFYFSDYSTDDNDCPMKSIGGIIKDEKGRVWLKDKYQGLGFFQFGELNPKIKIIGTEDGLWDDHIVDFCFDDNGDLWLSHWEGISKVSTEGLSVSNFGRENGIPGQTQLYPLSEGSIGLLKDGNFKKIWPDKLQSKSGEPKVIIKQIKIFDEPLNLNKNLNEINAIKLDHSQNYFSVYFDVINFFNSNAQTIQYKLEGLHDNWVNADGRDYASFSNLKGGDCTFQVRVGINNRDWENPKSIRIQVVPPFWLTGWFYSLCAIVAGGLVFAVYQYRIKKIKEKEVLKSEFKVQLAEVEMTALRAQMNPHFLFNCLNSIKLFIVEKDTKAASDYLTKFSKLIRLVLQNSKRKMVKLSDELEALELYVEMEKMRFDQNFEIRLSIEKEINVDKIELPPMLLQPYIENAIWHGLVWQDRPNILSVSIKKEKEQLICIIEDNGIGREAAQAKKTHRNAKKQSLGMSITKDRIQLTKQLYNINASIEVIDLKNEKGEASGTRVSIYLPIFS